MEFNFDNYARFVNNSTSPEKSIDYVKTRIIPKIDVKPKGTLYDIMDWYFNRDDFSEEYSLYSSLESLHGFVYLIKYVVVENPETKYYKRGARYPFEIFTDYDEEARLSEVEPKLIKTLLFYLSPFNVDKTAFFDRIKRYVKKKRFIRKALIDELEYKPPLGPFLGGAEYLKLNEKYVNCGYFRPKK